MEKPQSKKSVTACKHLRSAGRQAEKSSFSYRLGAVIEKGGRILSTGFNNVGKSSSLVVHRFNSIHAEQSAIIKLLKQPDGLVKLRGSTLYVTRILRSGDFAFSQPCEVCMSSIKAVGIKKVVFSIDNTSQGDIVL